MENREIKGSLWYIRYPIEGKPGHFISVATTRPETMLGDTAVAVHPEHPDLAALIGKRAILPLVGRAIPIVGDAYADPEKGTGAVKITPAHDFNDFAVGQRHDLPMPSVLDRQAMVTLDEIEDVLTAVPGVADPVFVRWLAGQARFAARSAIVAELERLGLLDKVESHIHQVPHGDRGGVPVEPLLTTQWYCNAGAPGEAGDRGGGDRQDGVRPETMGEHLLRLDARYPAVVHLAPALVGPPHPGLVRTGRRGVRRQGPGRRCRCRHAPIMATTKR